MLGKSAAVTMAILLAVALAFLMGAGITGSFVQVTGSTSELSAWSSVDSQGGGVSAFMNEQARFYANFTDLSTDLPITGGGTSCVIEFNESGAWTTPAAMTYNASSELYEYGRAFDYAGSYGWNATCDGTLLSYDLLEAQDNITVGIHGWWNNSWSYRVRIDVQNGNSQIDDWPVEVLLNLTDVMAQVGGAGTFDDNSTRVVEYDWAGTPLHEMPSQFDKEDGYDASQSALGTAIFSLNGTTSAGQARTFYMYFDVTRDGLKAPPSYATNISYAWTGDEINVNTTTFSFHFDTNRSENSSGLYQAEFKGYPVPFFMTASGDGEATIERTEYWNGTDNLSFDFYSDVTVVPGPVRLTIIERGDEIISGNPSLPTGEGMMVRKHHFYNKVGNETLGAIVKIGQDYTNVAGYSVTRNSTAAGAVGFDAARGWAGLGSFVSFYEGNASEPNSWEMVVSDNLEIMGMVHINESVAGFYVTNSSTDGRIGVQLDATSIPSGTSIHDLSAAYVGSGSTSEFVALAGIFADAPEATAGGYEPLWMVSATSTDHAFYNRNETIVVETNVSYDPYGLLSTVNVTLNNATPSVADDIVIQMLDDGLGWDQAAGDSVFTAAYNVTVSEWTGTWTAEASMYDAGRVRINTSAMNFTVTSTLFVNATVINRNGEVYREVNATADVMNYRQDVWQAGAFVNCSVYEEAILVSVIPQGNVTQLQPGRFFLHFTAPSYFGTFTLNCTAGKAGNSGSDISDFGAEDILTYVNITATPTSYTANNVTWLAMESFMIRVNATNTHNGTAYNATVFISLPQNMTANSTSHSCLTEEGDHMIQIARTCYTDFNVTIRNTTVPANFTLNITVAWNNSVGTNGYNTTNVNVTVNPTYIMDVPRNNITSMIVWQIKKNVANVTVRSLGNTPLQNVLFNVTGFGPDFNFTFEPVNFSSLPAGNETQFMVWLEVFPTASTGTYNGTLNVTSGNDGYKNILLNITVSGTNMSLSVWPLNFTAENITYYAGQNFTIGFNTTNIGNNTAYTTNMTLNFFSSYISTSNATTYPCGDVEPGKTCNGTFVLLVGNGTPSGNYSVNVSVGWGNPEMGVEYNWTFVNITVLSNVNLTVPDESVNGTAVHGTTATIGNFTLNSTGNDPVQGMQFTLIDPSGNLARFSMTLTPNIPVTQGGNLSAGQAVNVKVNVSIPLSYPNGTYSGYLNVTTSNAGYKTLGIEVTVPETRTWNATPLACEHAESPTYGIACNISLNNTGNVPIAFSIYPPANASSMNNRTWPSVTSFILQNQSGTYFSVYYNITGAELTFYNSSYNITAYLGSPSSRNISIFLTPFVKPIVSFNVTPSVIAQQGTTEILAYVTDQGGYAGLNFTTANVTRPDGTSDLITMRYVGGAYPFYIYQEFYPTDPINGTWGSTLPRGNYTVTVYAQDNLGLNETANASLYAYPVLSVSLETSRASGEYYQGETGTLLYAVTDAQGYAIGGVSAAIEIRDPVNRTVNMQNAAFISDPAGEPLSYPAFELFSDSPEGIYTATAVSSYNDTLVSVMCENSTRLNFTVLDRSPSLLTLDLEAPSEVSTSDGLIVYATVTDGASNFNPDMIRVSLYDALENTILDNVTMTQVSTGRYSRTFNTSVSVNTGVWRWAITAVDGSNVVVKDVFTRLVGGLFDVRDINPFDKSVPTLGISAVIENTGDIPQDAFIQWNLTRADTGAFITQGMDTVRINAASEYTYTINPSGVSYIGDVRILFVVTYSGTEKAAAYEYFTTTPEVPSEPKPPGGGGKKPSAPPGGGGGPAGAPGIKIIDYPQEIATEAGWTQYPSVTVNNTGSMALHSVMISLEGIPLSWYNVSPRLIPIINPGSTATFVININVPPGIAAREYYGTINATSDEASDSKLMAVIVFGSREELVRYQLAKLKQEFSDFKDDVNATAKLGEKDLSRVYDMIGEIQHQIDMTEGYLDARMFSEALDAVTTGWRLLDRARELFRDAPMLQPITILAIPDWMITLILILIIAILALLVVMNRYKKRLDRIFAFRKRAPAAAAESMEAAGDIISSRGAPREDIQAMATARREEERQKINKVLSLLEKEYNEGIISEKAYSDLRNRNLEKLKALGK